MTFNEITKDVVRKAIAAPRAIDQNLVDAQQARRVLDRIVGYQLSPLLWKKVRRGLSAGRVQSVATRLVVDRENEIRAFTPQEYWTIDAALDRTGKPGGFTARYYGDPKKNELGSREDVAFSVSQSMRAAPFRLILPGRPGSGGDTAFPSPGGAFPCACGAGACGGFAAAQAESGMPQSRPESERQSISTSFAGYRP